MPPPFPELPIVTPDPPRKSQAEKYGGLYYLGWAGLVVLIGLVGWFGFGVWSLRDVWRNGYVLHDETRPIADRLDAAYALGHNPRVNQRQLFDIALRKPLPSLARYVVAESLTSEAMSADPSGYALMVARSEGWPDWLRLLLLRPMAYGAGQGFAIPEAPLAELRQHSDPIIALWATYTQAVSGEGNVSAARTLDEVSKNPGPNRELAALLRVASKAQGPARPETLDRATLWLRAHHPGAVRLWEGWEERGGHIVRASAPKLREPSSG